MLYRSIAIGTLVLASSFSNAINVPPLAPEINTPENNATDVSKTPVLTASTDEQIATDWLIYEPSEFVQIIGGWQTEDSGLQHLDNVFQDIDYPLNTTIDGKAVTTLRVYPHGQAELYDADSNKLAFVKMQPDVLANMQPTRNGIIAVRQFSDAVAVNWYLQSKNSEIEWDATLQALFTATGYAGIKTSINAFSHEFFDLDAGTLGCGLRINGQEPDGFEYTPAGVKTAFTTNGNNYSNFSMLCNLDDDGEENLAVFSVVTPGEINLPAISYLSSASNSTTVNPALKAGTDYRVQARVKDGDFYSAWSAPVNFTTAPPQTDYVFTTPTNTSFTAGVSQQLSFTLTNQGQEAGSPVVSVRLPFSVLSTSGTFNASVAGGSCQTSISNNITNLNCTVTELAPNSSVTVIATLGLPVGTDEIEYRACDDGFCTGVDYNRLPVSVTAANTGNGSNNGSTTETTSSSGGAMWMLLLLLPALVAGRKR